MSTLEIVTLCIAGWGALLGTVTATAQIIRWLEHRKSKSAQIKVSISGAIIGFDDGTTSAGMIRVKMANTGEVPVVLQSYALDVVGHGFGIVHIPNRNRTQHDARDPSVQLPHTLEPGHSCDTYYPEPSVKSSLSSRNIDGKFEVIGTVSSAVGETFRSTAVEFDTKDLESENGVY